MKVEKISENKIKITLTIDELKARQISINDIEKDVNLARNLFLDLIEESEINGDFIIDDSQLYIEASSDNNNLFVVTITKIDHIPELSKYALMNEIIDKKKTVKKTSGKSLKQKSKTNKSLERSADKTNYVVDSTLYAFESMDDIFNMCDVFKNNKIYFGKNELYSFNNNFFIIFDKTTVRNKRFLKTFVILSEFCTNYYSSSIFNIAIKEKGKLLIEKKALQTLIKL